MAAAAAAAAERTPSARRLVSLAVLAAFLLGALWLESALHVSRSLERFLAVECSVWGHEESCFVAIRWAGTAGFVALASAVALSYGEAARRREQVVRHPPARFFLLPAALPLFSSPFFCGSTCIDFDCWCSLLRFSWR